MWIKHSFLINTLDLFVTRDAPWQRHIVWTDVNSGTIREPDNLRCGNRYNELTLPGIFGNLHEKRVDIKNAAF